MQLRRSNAAIVIQTAMRHRLKFNKQRRDAQASKLAALRKKNGGATVFGKKKGGKQPKGENFLAALRLQKVFRGHKERMKLREAKKKGENIPQAGDSGAASQPGNSTT